MLMIRLLLLKKQKLTNFITILMTLKPVHNLPQSIGPTIPYLFWMSLLFEKPMGANDKDL